jgi:hypothetical protein
MDKIVRGFASLDYNLILISHIKDQTDGGTGEIFYKLDISGAAAHQIPAAVNVAMFMDDRAVPLVGHDDGEEEYEDRSVIYTHKLAKFEWIKDRTYALDPIIEADFERGFTDIIETINARKPELQVRQSISVDFDPSPSVEVEKAEPRIGKRETTAPSADEVAAKVAEADAKLAAAKAERTAATTTPPEPEPKVDETPQPGEIVERSTVVTDEDSPRSVEQSSVDLDALSEGDVVTIPGGGLGFKFAKTGSIMQIQGYRVVYETSEGKILSRVCLPDTSVRPLPNSGMDTGLFCQVTGVEISAAEANLSRLRTRKLLCEEEYGKEIQKAKKNMTRK